MDGTDNEIKNDFPGDNADLADEGIEIETYNPAPGDPTEPSAENLQKITPEEHVSDNDISPEENPAQQQTSLNELEKELGETPL